MQHWTIKKLTILINEANNINKNATLNDNKRNKLINQAKKKQM